MDKDGRIYEFDGAGNEVIAPGHGNDDKRRKKQEYELRKIDKRIKAAEDQIKILERQRARHVKKMRFYGADVD